jgi:hypothetical protein
MIKQTVNLFSFPVMSTSSNFTDEFVQVFQLVGTQWEQLGNTITEGIIIYGSGESLALSSDGFTLAVGDLSGDRSVKVQSVLTGWQHVEPTWPNHCCFRTQ